MGNQRLRKSRYCFLIKDGDHHLAYSSARNSFHAVSEYVYDLICHTSISLDEIEKLPNAQEIETLHTLGLLVTEEEDNRIVDNLRLHYLRNSFSSSALNLTVIPTLGCNLKCPYCFEKNKPAGLMSKTVCDNLIKFIKNQKDAKRINITWFGGEPLVGVSVIQYILSELDKLEEQKLSFQSIVTNGTLLQGDVLSVFEKHPLQQIQITLDGKKETHDTKRIRHDGTGTYDTILDNLDQFIIASPDTHVSVRVNIDKTNVEEFMDIYEYLHHRYAGKKNLSVYPGILKACGKLEQSSPFLLNKDMIDIHKRFAEQGYPVNMPFTMCSGCTASCISGFVIGPQGEIYKCWEDVGCADKVVGNIDGKSGNAPHLFVDYLMHGSHILDKDCEKCSLLPVCSSDCPHDRLAAREGHFKREELCPYFKAHDYKGLEDDLLHIYHIYKTPKKKEA